MIFLRGPRLMFFSMMPLENNMSMCKMLCNLKITPSSELMVLDAGSLIHVLPSLEILRALRQRRPIIHNCQ